MKHLGWVAFVVLSAGLSSQHACAQAVQPVAETAVIQGIVRDSAGSGVTDAVVSLGRGDQEITQTKTDARGAFQFSLSTTGTYTIRASKAGFDKAEQVLAIEAHSTKHLSLVLTASTLKRPESSSSSQMRFDDQSGFVVAGLTDWTAVGGHGSDANLRTSETLAKDTSRLAQQEKPRQVKNSSLENDLKTAVAQHPNSFEANHQLGDFYLRERREVEAVPFLRAAYQLRPDDYANGYDLAVAYKYAGNLPEAGKQVGNLMSKNDRADLHRLLGDIDELAGDPLTAEREYETATRMQPTEENYFAWAVELLVHRAIEPARKIFDKGVSAYPKSERMLAGLGAALYASGLYEEAAQKLCAASDLQPADPAPYLFLGKMQQTSTTPLPCAKDKLARFAHDQPDSALANYYYAVSLWKQRTPVKDVDWKQVESLLQRAVALDSKLSQAYVQLGTVLSERGDLNSAVTVFERAIETDPDLPEAHFRLGQTYKRQGNLQKANEQFQAYERITKDETATIEKQRREMRQFVIVLKNEADSSQTPE